jgi:predicted transcriptional regulator
MKNRSELEIMASILRSAVGKWEYKTTIMNNASVSHSQLIRYLAIAVERGLVEYSEVRDLYRITEAGLVFLDKYRHLLNLLPKIPDLPEDLIHCNDKEYEEEAKEKSSSVVSESIQK